MKNASIKDALLPIAKIKVLLARDLNIDFKMQDSPF
jgi:hypothetical protein